MAMSDCVGTRDSKCILCLNNIGNMVLCPTNSRRTLPWRASIESAGVLSAQSKELFLAPHTTHKQANFGQTYDPPSTFLMSHVGSLI